MEIKDDLAKRFKDVILNNSWVANNSFKNQLSDLPLETAQYKLGTLHTIASLAQHIHYYVAGILNVLKGGNLEIKDAFSFDFNPINTEDEWQNVLSVFWADAEEFALKVAALPDEKLSEIFVKVEYGTYHFNINTLIEHSYYHLGQIVLLKKLICQAS